MSTNDRFETYLKRFLAEHIKTLPKRSFDAPEDYEFMFFSLFQGWKILKKDQHYSSTRFKRLESLIDMINKFDDSLERPLQKRALQSIQFNPNWRAIQNEARNVETQLS